MDQQLTLGETVRRLRRRKRWSLGTLAERTGLSYSHLSRVENDSASPQADGIARLAEALDGDLRALLELAACLPEVILQRISRQEGGHPSGSLPRAAHRAGKSPSGAITQFVIDLASHSELPLPEAHDLADAVARLVTLPPAQRASITRLILTLESNREDQ